MNVRYKNYEDLKSKGVYIILNTVNRKYYIGSTEASFQDRFKHHYIALKNNKHKNMHLQSSWNKYGEDAFVFIIYQILTENIRNVEQHYLDIRIKDMCYNINSNATGPCIEQVSINKQIESRKRFYAECLPYYKKVKNKEIELKDVPEIFQDRIKSYLEHTPWNKNKHYASTEHLKVPHKLGDRSKDKNTKRSKLSEVYVYDDNKKFLGRFRSAKDLEELSDTLKLPVKSRFSISRMGVPLMRLQSVNINKAIKNGKTYKGLYFFNKPLHPGMDDANEPKSVEVWDDNTEVIEEIKESSTPYSIETETQKRI